MPSRSDKLFQKRRAATSSSLKRKPATLEPAKRILIVCEGSVTEPEYFKFLKRKKKLPNLDIDICGEECGSSPFSVVSFAEEKANSEGRYDNGGYDQVYCVFDRDAHTDFNKATSRILTLNKANSRFLAREIKAIISFPCFEVWLIFHFIYSRAPLVESGGLSGGGNANKLLRQQVGFEGFEKGFSMDQLDRLFDKIDTAVANAATARIDVAATGEPNPSTDLDLLVNAIRNSGVSER